MGGVWERARVWWADGWLSLPLLAVGLIGTGPAAVLQPDAARPPDPPAYTLIVAAALALAARRRPGVALAVNGALVSAYLAAGYPFGPILLTVPFAMYGVAAAWPAGRAAAVVAADFAVLMVAAFAKNFAEGGDRPANTVVWGAIALVALAAGVTVRTRREAAAGLRTAQARRVASEERLRMAQDLHDSIGHGLAVIAMQTGVALHVLDRDAGEARRALEAARAASRAALDDLRAELDRLRGDRPEPGPRPRPGLGDLDALAERVRAGGIEVSVEVGPDLGVSGPVDVAAFRIVREALTNVLRHADAAAARVRVGRDGDDLLVEVIDTGPGTGRVSGAGLGIAGMRAQAERLGGTLHAGRRPGGGFVVRARLPREARP
ncbi:sensor histidine kinase [Bailinhaonella thermotolerans]|uniref:Oxygen sensor histidine kinase NreB n=1 Tax=Bailinhaonella thermotolerans TaxID=1070861 RepID=A0A3A4BJU2_9ACTN|nr:histidine kinase [Bailinhaonella thermotolerans]RJL35544.1 sensor histidine kinase [Bailinhaonella thermotolerans]